MRCAACRTLAGCAARYDRGVRSCRSAAGSTDCPHVTSGCVAPTLARVPRRGARTLARTPRRAHGPRAPLTAGLACPTVPQPTARSEAPDGRLVLGKPGTGELRNSAGYRYLRHVPSARRPKNPCKGRKRSMSAGQTMRRTTANEDRSRQGGVRRVPTRAPIQASASGFALRQPGVTTRGGPRLNGECGAGDEC